MQGRMLTTHTYHQAVGSAEVGKAAIPMCNRPPLRVLNRICSDTWTKGGNCKMCREYFTETGPALQNFRSLRRGPHLNSPSCPQRPLPHLFTSLDSWNHAVCVHCWWRSALVAGSKDQLVCPAWCSMLATPPHPHCFVFGHPLSLSGLCRCPGLPPLIHPWYGAGCRIACRNDGGSDGGH